MCGRADPQVTILAFIDLENGIPASHPLRTIKRRLGPPARQRPPETHLYAQSRPQTSAAPAKTRHHQVNPEMRPHFSVVC